MSEPELLVEHRADGVVLFTLNRRQARNTVSFPLWDEFGAALSAIETGGGRAVSSCEGRGGGSGGARSLRRARGGTKGRRLMQFDLRSLPLGPRYKLLNSTITPRPIA